MNTSPENKKTKKTISFNELMNNNKIVFLISLIIAFFVWVAVAMYASPEESFTIYNIPITVNTENSLVSQRGYKNFWQSDEKIDVTVTGPRYLVTTLTADDIIVNANLNTVDNAGLSELVLKVSLKQDSPDIAISSQSKTKVSVYFDTEMQKEVKINFDGTVLSDKVPEGYQLRASELIVTTATVKGPETEVNKIVSIEATPELTDEFIFETSTLPLILNMVGNTTTDTVSVNKYVSIDQEQEFFVKVSIDKFAELKPDVEFTGTQTGDVAVEFNVENVLVKIDTAYKYEDETLKVLTVDYSTLTEGKNTFTFAASDVVLPEGIKFTDNTFTFVANVTFTQAE